MEIIVAKAYLEENSFILEGMIKDYKSSPYLLYAIPLNKNTSIKIHIDRIDKLEDSVYRIVSFFDSAENAEFVEMFNIGYEVLSIIDVDKETFNANKYGAN